ncbi:hypothetical protein [Falsiroseomonas oryzae]|uniref:hypothetical protein n=1 Tax=Falsiroseomonas oryzae TaxID=2766473 RepID=UPI0022EABD3A|nr:hypothetical protein [Roseomonas sp. MO-31]
MPQTPGGFTLPILLSLLAGFAALAGLSSAAAVLLLGLGLTGLVAALGFGVVSLGAGLWAAVLAFAPRTA